MRGRPLVLVSLCVRVIDGLYLPEDVHSASFIADGSSELADGMVRLGFWAGRRLNFSLAPLTLKPSEIVVYGAVAVGIASVLAGLAIMGARYYVENCASSNYHDTAAPGPVCAGDDSVQVIVHANGQEAELEIRADGFDSYEMLRELVVDALPGMFDDSDEIVLDYLDERSSWVRVKTRTPLEALKASGSIKISCRATIKKSRRQGDSGRKKKSRS
mmetsp:Transcript_22842/g.61253  ORF Transcript_22842/g.61253 Transcript_22842/m.61253 type:complete len:216 (+) Transcript_22842:75-722(+)|eukprot:3383383-Prymnesium_polylepis.1